jgi:glutamyl/glutaminyl-tRNA synthetase
MDGNTMHFNKTRIAPTPSGFLHLGNAYSFALTAALAQKTGAKILLRIDDLDKGRVQKEYVQDIFDTLNFLEIPWHEGPSNMQEYEKEYSQVHRMGLYDQALDQLRERGAVFACTCSRAQIRMQNPDDVYPGTCRDKGLSLDASEVNWRLQTDDHAQLTVNSLFGGPVKSPLPSVMRDFVVRKKDDFPAYQLASVVDDIHFGVDLVIRGQDLWDSTLAQLYLAGKMGTSGFQKCTFHHHSLLSASAGIKLSKSAGDTSIRYLRTHGTERSAIYEQISRMLGLMNPANSWQQLATPA